MTIQRRSEIIPLSGVIDLPRGNFFLLNSATAFVNVRAHRDGVSERFDNIAGGLYIRRVEPWLAMQLTGAAGTTVEYFIGTENVQEDETDTRLAVTAIAGAVSTVEQPSSAIVNNAPVVVPDPGGGNEDVLIAANASRRRLRVFADAANPGSCFVRAVTGGNAIAELQPGTSQQFDTLQGLWIFNANAADCTFYLCEEQ